MGVCNEELDANTIVLVYTDFTGKKRTGYNGKNLCFTDDVIYKLTQKYTDYKDDQLQFYKNKIKYPYKLEFSKVEGDKVIYDLKYGKPDFTNRLVISSNKNMDALYIEYNDKSDIPCYYMQKDRCDMAQFIYSDLSRADIDLLKKYDHDYLLKNAEVVIPLIVEIKRLCNIS